MKLCFVVVVVVVVVTFDLKFHTTNGIVLDGESSTFINRLKDIRLAHKHGGLDLTFHEFVCTYMIQSYTK